MQNNKNVFGKLVYRREDTFNSYLTISITFELSRSVNNFKGIIPRVKQVKLSP
jgi:hypothetical protein